MLFPRNRTFNFRNTLIFKNTIWKNQRCSKISIFGNQYFRKIFHGDQEVPFHQEEIISKNDFDSAKQTVFTAKQSYQTAKEQAGIILEKANDINILIAKNKLEKTSTNLESLEDLLNKKIITAPLSGVIMEPENSTQNSRKLHIGKETKPVLLNTLSIQVVPHR